MDSCFERTISPHAGGYDSTTIFLRSMSFLEKPENKRLVAYWVTTALLESELVLGGVWDVMQAPQVRGVVHRLGYPSYFLVVLGIWKLLGAVALAIPRFPRLKEWTYAGVFFNFTGAIASHLASGVIEVGALLYLMVMTGIMAASWALRPASRKNFPAG